MTKAEFHNALRILTGIDRHELEAAGVTNLGGAFGWDAFRADPYRWFIQASDKEADAIWRIIESRQRS